MVLLIWACIRISDVPQLDFPPFDFLHWKIVLLFWRTVYCLVAHRFYSACAKMTLNFHNVYVEMDELNWVTKKPMWNDKVGNDYGWLRFFFFCCCWKAIETLQSLLQSVGRCDSKSSGFLKSNIDNNHSNNGHENYSSSCCAKAE